MDGEEEAWKVVYTKHHLPGTQLLEIPDLTPFTQYSWKPSTEEREGGREGYDGGEVGSRGGEEKERGRREGEREDIEEDQGEEWKRLEHRAWVEDYNRQKTITGSGFLSLLSETRQVNIVGSSPLRGPSRLIQTLQAAPETPPSNLTLLAATQTSLHVRWKNDIQNGRTTFCASTRVPDTSALLANLSSYTYYMLTLTAFNNTAGDGPPSEHLGPGPSSMRVPDPSAVRAALLPGVVVLSGKHLSTVDELVTLDSGGFTALKLNSKTLNSKNPFLKKNWTRSPPRPSPEGLHYSDEDIRKTPTPHRAHAPPS
ncbi:hypothetical protein NHX12_018321 [Muraenolepis orangiensis]|uniref:Fibronectin type-III domain-containing protein n=1 Tax=Muraenolepis orangiensis TaxID=630683 RepID=A0A9Q0EWC1_9TELE|nr:hypothetical protein NHX12_018321 [Muraenolepis orangiensis]